MGWQILPIARFGDFRASWQTLSEYAGGTPVLHPDFLVPLLEVFATPAERLAVFQGADGPRAMAIVGPSGPFTWQTLQPANAPVGLWLSDGAVPMEDLLISLVRALPGLVGLIGVLEQDPDITPRMSDSGRSRTLDYIETARISIDRPFEEYWGGRGKNLRRNMKRQNAQLEKEGIVARLEVLRDPKDMRNAIADYARLEGAGWKSERGTAVGLDDLQSRFYVGVMERFCAAGAGQVFRYWYGNALVATDLCISHGDRFVILKTTYDETIRKTSPAQLMRYEMFQSLFQESKIRRIEFYGRVMDWHRQWTDEIRTMYHVNHYRWPLLRKLHGAARARGAAPKLAPPTGETAAACRK